jgi:hypothetical protein
MMTAISALLVGIGLKNQDLGVKSGLRPEAAYGIKRAARRQ